MQYFKGDDLEKKFYESGKVILDELSLQKDLLLAGAYEAAPLGDVLYESERSPLSKAIVQSIFRTSFKDIFDSFAVAGSFESYIAVFKKIFGETALVEFTIPAAGKLNIDIIANEIELSDIATRYISNNAYVFDQLIDEVGDVLVVQTIKGFQSQYELEQMLNEMVPAGIFTTISLTLGS